MSASCAGADSGTADVVVRDSAGIEIVENGADRLASLPAWQMGEPRVRVGVVEGPEEVQFGDIAAGVFLADGGFALADRGPERIRVFDADGEFRVAVGGVGEGPSEFRGLYGVMALPDGDFLAWDGRRRRIVRFSPSGDLRGEASHAAVSASFTDLAAVLGPRVILTDRRLAPNREVGRFYPEQLDVMAIPIEGGAPDTVLTLPNGSSGGFVIEGYIMGSTGPFWEAKTAVAASGDRLYVGPGDRPELRVYDTGIRLLRIVRWTGPANPVNPDLVEAELQRIEADNRDVLTMAYEALGTADSIPYYDGLIADPSGWLWVSEHRLPPRDPRPPSYILFDPSGVAVATLALPSATRVLDVRADTVLAVVEDDMEVQRVVVAPIIPVELGPV